MGRVFPVALMIPVVAGLGIGEGLWTGRWGQSAELETAVARLADVPQSLGDWQGQDRELDPKQVAAAQLSGYLSRQFVHRKTGVTVTVLLLVGRPGPLAVHTPDICFQGAGNFMTAPAVKHALTGDGCRAELSTATFRKEEAAEPEPMRVFWAWSADGSWQAPGNPRATFAGYRALYKLYVVRPLTNLDEPVACDPSVDFMKLLLPELSRRLFPGSQSAQESP